MHEYEYDLYLMPDINTKAGNNGGNTQWYYFAVTNMQTDVEYKLNIVNLVCTHTHTHTISLSLSLSHTHTDDVAHAYR